MKSLHRWQTLLLTPILLLAVSCSMGNPASPGGPSSSTTPLGANNPQAQSTPIKGLVESEVETNQAKIDSVDIQTMSGSPTMVVIEIKGNFPDGCTQISQMAQEVDGNTIKVTVYTSRPKDSTCTEALVPFDEKMPLDVSTLSPGTYTVDVNGIQASLVLSAEALTQSSNSSACPIPSQGTKVYNSNTSTADDYCFLYPDTYEINDSDPDNVSLSGPSFAAGKEQLKITLTIQSEIANNRSTTDLANERLSQLSSGGANLVRNSIKLSGEEAIFVDGVPGNVVKSRMIMVVHGITAFTITLTPVDPGYEQPTNDAIKLWEMVSNSFSFIQ